MLNKKKNVLPALISFLLLVSCASARNAREAAMQEWLSKAKRPVKVTKHNPYQHLTATRGSHYYTLIDREGNVFIARNVRFELPEVIE